MSAIGSGDYRNRPRPRLQRLEYAVGQTSFFIILIAMIDTCKQREPIEINLIKSGLISKSYTYCNMLIIRYRNVRIQLLCLYMLSDDNVSELLCSESLNTDLKPPKYSSIANLITIHNIWE